MLHECRPFAGAVKVARSPWDYMPEAVAAAELVLKERGLTADEIAVEEWNLAQKEMSDALQLGCSLPCIQPIVMDRQEDQGSGDFAAGLALVKMLFS